MSVRSETKRIQAMLKVAGTWSPPSIVDGSPVFNCGEQVVFDRALTEIDRRPTGGRGIRIGRVDTCLYWILLGYETHVFASSVHYAKDHAPIHLLDVRAVAAEAAAREGLIVNFESVNAYLRQQAGIAENAARCYNRALGALEANWEGN